MIRLNSSAVSRSVAIRPPPTQSWLQSDAPSGRYFHEYLHRATSPRHFTAARRAMETSLHRQLKQVYAGPAAQTEVPWDGGYRIDAVCDSTLIEIQHGQLAAIREKIGKLLRKHQVVVVKPIVVRKRLIKLARKNGREVSRRLSPKRGKLLDIFDELVYFTRVFPHPNLTLDIALVDTDEYRYPGHGRRRRHRDNDFQIADQQLTDLRSIQRLKTATDLWDMLGVRLPAQFDTAELAGALSVDRHEAQRIAYCLREMRTVTQVGKRGNAKLYKLARRKRGAA